MRTIKNVTLGIIFFTLMLFGLAAKAESTVQQEAEVLNWLVVLNKNEIMTGKLALTKQINEKVKAYANLMIRDHLQNLNQTLKLISTLKIKPATTDLVKALKDQGQTELNTLKSLKGIEFEKAYMGAMVNDHTEALKIINQFISNVGGSRELTFHLKETRDHIESHLNEAKSILSSL